MRSLLFFSLMILALTGCQDDEISGRSSIIGTWNYDYGGDDPLYSQRTQVKYSLNGKYETRSIVLKKGTEEVIGYQGGGIGTYRVSGDTIFTKLTKGYISLSQDYPFAVPFGELKETILPPSDSEFSTLFTVFSEGAKIEFMYPTCTNPPLCLDKIIYSRN